MTNVRPSPMQSVGYKLANRDCEEFPLCRDYARSLGWRGLSCSLCPLNRPRTIETPVELPDRVVRGIARPDIRSSADLIAACDPSVPDSYREMVERTNAFGLRARPSAHRRRWFERRRRWRRRRG